jgi:Helix-turn-helix domain
MYALATRVDDNGICYPSYATLVADTGLSLNSVRRAIRSIPPNELQVLQKGRATGHPSRYRITIDCAQTCTSQGQDCAETGHSQFNNCGHMGHSTMPSQGAHRVLTEHLTPQELPIELPINRKHAPGFFGSATKEPADPPVPATLQLREFMKAWSDFDDYRRHGKAKKEWTYRAKELALEKCVRLGPDRAVAALEHSMMNGWTGIFEPKDIKQETNQSVDEFGRPKL